MAITYTPRLGLELQDDNEDINSLVNNFTKLDRSPGIQWVQPNVMPDNSMLYDGALVGEYTTNKIWAARKNQGGTYDRVWQSYPYTFRGGTVATSIGSGPAGVWVAMGFATFVSDRSFNSSAADIQGGYWVCPVDGIYFFRIWHEWQLNANGERGVTLWLNGSAISTYQHNQKANTTQWEFRSTLASSFTFKKGDLVASGGWQDSGATLGVTDYMDIVMISPTGLS